MRDNTKRVEPLKSLLPKHRRVLQSDILLNVFLAIAVDNLADTGSSEEKKDEGEAKADDEAQENQTDGVLGSTTENVARRISKDPTAVANGSSLTEKVHNEFNDVTQLLDQLKWVCIYIRTLEYGDWNTVLYLYWCKPVLARRQTGGSRVDCTAKQSRFWGSSLDV